MEMRRRAVLKLLSASTATAAAASLRAAKAEPVIERDVCILGGGASGTFSAVQLIDAGKRVVVVERQPRLGGHTETYRDPETGTAVDYGVIVYHDIEPVRWMFARFDVPLTPRQTGQSANKLFDFTTGERLPDDLLPSQAETAQALGVHFAYLQQLSATYYDLDEDFDLPQPIPAELLMPFGQFAEQFGVQNAVHIVFRFCQGRGDLLRLPAVYVLRNFNAQLVSSIFNASFLVVQDGNATIYERAREFLGDSALLSSSIRSIRRDRRGAEVRVDTPDGIRLIRAKKLLVTIPPTLRNLGIMDLDQSEQRLFGRFDSKAYYTGLVVVDGLPPDRGLWNLRFDSLYNLPRLPGLFGISPTPLSNVWNLKYGSDSFIPDQVVKRRIVGDIERLNDPDLPEPPRVREFLTFSGHNPFELQVSAKDLADGFYTRLYELQGRNHTYYTGAAFHTHDSGALWQFTHNRVLPLLLT